MFKQSIVTAAVGVFGLLLSPGVSSAQLRVNSPNVTGIYAGTNYQPYRYNSFGPGYYGRPFTSPSVYYAPAPSYYYAPAPSYSAAPAPAYYYSPPVVTAPVVETTSAASIEVRVPPDAEIWFEGDKTKQTGSVRTFESPPLQPGREFTYAIRASWTEGDKVVDLKRQVKVQAGRRSVVDFLAR